MKNNEVIELKRARIVSPKEVEEYQKPFKDKFIECGKQYFRDNKEVPFFKSIKKSWINQQIKKLGMKWTEASEVQMWIVEGAREEQANH